MGESDFGAVNDTVTSALENGKIFMIAWVEDYALQIVHGEEVLVEDVVKVKPLVLDAVSTQNHRYLDEMGGGLVDGEGMREEFLVEGGIGRGGVEVDDGAVQLELEL